MCVDEGVAEKVCVGGEVMSSSVGGSSSMKRLVGVGGRSGGVLVC